MENLESIKLPDNIHPMNASRPALANNDGSRPWEPQRLSPLHEEIIRRLALGYKNYEVASALKITTVTVTNIKYSSQGQALLAQLGVIRNELTKEMASRVASLGLLSVDTLENILTNDNAPLSLKGKTATDLLAMNGIRTTGDTAPKARLSDEILAQIKKNAISAGVLVPTPEPEDIEYEEVIESID